MFLFQIDMKIIFKNKCKQIGNNTRNINQSEKWNHDDNIDDIDHNLPKVLKIGDSNTKN